MKFRPLSETKFINDANLVSYWKLDGNSNDSKGSNNGTNNSISYVDAKYGQGASFNNSYNSYISLPNLALNTGDFTISFLVKPLNFVNGSHYYFSESEYDYNQFRIMQYGTAGVRVQHYNRSTDIAVDIASSLMSTTDYNFITIVRISDTLYAYLNGKLINSGAGWSGRNCGGAYRQYLGKINDNTAGDSFYGIMDDVAIFTRGLSSSEVNELYQGMTYGEYLGAGSSTTKLLLHLNGNSTDSSGNGNNGTDTNITYSQANGKFGMGAGFNGSSSRITIPNNASTQITGDITIGAWVKTATLVNNMTIVNKGIGGATNVPYEFRFNSDASTSGRVIMLRANSSDYGFYSTTNRAVTNGIWTLVGVSVSGTTVEFYVNGSKVAKTEERAMKTNITDSGTVAEIGARNNGSFFNGAIDEVIVENIAWTDAKWAKHYTMTKGRFGIL